MDIQKILKNKGYRVTDERKCVIKAIGNHPLTTLEIHTQLKASGVNIDIASVYRSLDLFVEIGLVRALEFGEGKKRYELVDENHHHHHLVCNNCGSIEDVVLNEEHFARQVKTKSRFKIDHHHLEFFGRCANCQ